MPNNLSQQEKQNLLTAIELSSNNNRRTALINSWNLQGNQETTRQILNIA